MLNEKRRLYGTAQRRRDWLSWNGQVCRWLWLCRLGRRFHPEEFHHHLQVFPCFFFLAWIAQQVSRMESHDELGSPKVIPASTQIGHAVIHGQQVLSCSCTQSNNHLRLDHVNLLHEER